MQQGLFPIEPNKGKALKVYMQTHFNFSVLKKSGLFPKEMKFNDYEGQAKRICTFFGFENIYEYSKHEIRCHISYASGFDGLGSDRPISVNERGEMIIPPFVETIFPNQMHI